MMLSRKLIARLAYFSVRSNMEGRSKKNVASNRKDFQDKKKFFEKVFEVFAV
jgi:hypothetical protein